MKKYFRCVVMTFLLPLGACSSGTDFPETVSGPELEKIFRDRAAELRDTPRANGVRSFGLFFEREDGKYTAEKGRVLVVQQEDDAYLLGYYMPGGNGQFERIGEPLRVADTRTPRVGNPRGKATCLRAPLTSGSGEWYGCVERGRLVTGVE